MAHIAREKISLAMVFYFGEKQMDVIVSYTEGIGAEEITDKLKNQGMAVNYVLPVLCIVVGRISEKNFNTVNDLKEVVSIESVNQYFEL